MRPMLAVPTPTPGRPPTGDEWVHEVKWDGVRVMADRSGGQLRLLNRTELDVTVAYPEIVASLGGLPGDFLVDGEVVAMAPDGRPTLQAIAHRMHVRDPDRTQLLSRTRPVTYLVFDLLRLQGQDLVGLPLAQRRELLDSLDLAETTSLHLGRPCWQPSPQHDDGDLLAQATRDARLEGVMSKRRSSVYQPGVRSSDWLKVPHTTELVGVIGGWVPETDTPSRLGSVWVGHAADEPTFEADPVLYPLARVGSGLSLAQRRDLLQVLRETERPTCPFDPRPEGPEVRRTTWVEPLLCVQIRYLTRSESGTLRQPVLRVLRPDVLPVEAAYAELLDVEG
ncbi:MAG: DNA ligase [Actinomycetia bacterium]|nr:DNA ligase [Actinomycetes bacterium]